jgi:hypothetical protein
MKKQLKNCVIVALALSASACNHTGALRTEIAQIEARVLAVEGEITTGAGAIAQPGKDIRTRVAYRPFQAWATGFGTKTFTYRQTQGGGDLERQSRKCILFGEKRPGYRVFIHEDQSTKVDLTVGPLSFEPTETGLKFNSAINLFAKTQFAAAGRAPCIGGWSPTVSIGAEVRSRPNTVLELKVVQGDEFKPKYSVAVISPDRLDLEFRTGIQIPYVGDVDIRHTFRENIDDVTLFEGQLDLLVENTSELVLPGGETRVYTFATADPAITTDQTGIAFETDVEIKRQPDGGSVPLK